jgi:hypothetical protein
MLTSAMPAVTRALAGVLPPVALKQLTQALGNCNQTLTHRGDIIMQPDSWSNVTNNNGTYTSYPPSANDYRSFVTNVIGEGGAGDVINNSYFGSPTYSTSFNYGDTFVVTGGPPGDPGRAGRDGFDGTSGVDGFDGRDGTDGFDGLAGPPGNPGAAGGNGIDGRDGQAGAAGGRGGRGGRGAAGAAGEAGAAGFNGRDGRDGAIDIVAITSIVDRLLKRKPAVDRTETEDEQVSYVKRKTVNVVTYVDFESCTKREEEIDVISELTPKFVVKKVRDIPTVVYGP